MGAGDGSSPQHGPAEIAEIEAGLRAIIAQLDAAGQMLAAAYVELALGVLAPQLRSPPASLDGDDAPPDRPSP